MTDRDDFFRRDDWALARPPEWTADWTADLTEAWAELWADPESKADFSETCDGLFSVEWEACEYPDDGKSYPALTLEWLVVEDFCATATYGREQAIKMLGIERVQQIENLEAEKVSEGQE